MDVVIIKGIIYRIRNRLNDLDYIGQTRTHRKKGDRWVPFGAAGRFKEHTSSARHEPTYHVDRMMKQLGVDNFYFEQIAECDLERLDEMEVNCILQYNSLAPNGYNVVLGNPHGNFNSEWTAQALRDYYSILGNRERHSEVHLDHFKAVGDVELSQIEIKPINEEGQAKLVYIYFRYKTGGFYRRRYGGKHQSFQESYQRAVDDARSAVPEDMIVDFTKLTTDELWARSIHPDAIEKIEMKLHKMKTSLLVSVYVHHTGGVKRRVFGGKTVKLPDAYDKAKKFVDLLRVDGSLITKQQSLLATLSN